VPDYEQVCDHSTWVCRIVCNAGMLPGMKASKCVAKHCASHNRRNQHIVQKMIAASTNY
ncbi:EIF3A, partial [Symbiodinium microadriaticum]